VRKSEVQKNGTDEGEGAEVNVSLTRELIGQAQNNDEFCQKIRDALHKGERLSYFLDRDQFLYYGTTEEGNVGNSRIVVPASLQEQIIRQYHDPVFAGHQGVKRTQNRLKIHYFWPTLAKDVEEYIQKCESCAKMKGGRTPVAPLGELPETTEPMQITSIDICGPYPVTSRGNRYLLTFIDHFSRYPETIAIPSQDTETFARALVTQVFTRHGCPQVLSSDRGTNFMSVLFQEMCKVLHIKRINSTAFNPKMQGKVEKFHAGLNQTMSHYVNKYGNNWDDFVDYALMVQRATPHTITKYSPFYLLHGREMPLPNTDDLSARVDDSVKVPKLGDSVEMHARTLAERLKEAYEIVREYNKLGREKQKAQYDKNTKLVIFSVGDYVYIKEMAVRPGKSKKFRDRWRGPYLVTQRLSDWNYQIQIKPGKVVIVNVNHMKKCHNPPARKKITKSLARDTVARNRKEKSTSVDEETSCVPGRYIYRPLLDEVPQNSTETGDMTEDESDEPDNTVHDPNWLPRTQNQGQSSDNNQQPSDQPRYNFRSADTQTPEVATPVGQTETDASVDETQVPTPAIPIPETAEESEQRPRTLIHCDDYQVGEIIKATFF
jgi:transposase InsO family protein